MRRILIAVSVVFALGACATPFADDPQAARDFAECNYEADKATATIRSGIEAGVTAAQLRRQCMALRGYVRSAPRPTQVASQVPWGDNPMVPQ